MSTAAADATTKQSIAKRILEAAHRHLVASGSAAMKMDDLSGELGMSKKTLYNYFPGKDAIVDAVVEELSRSIRARFEEILSDPNLNSAQKLSRVLDEVGSRISKLSPTLLRDLKKNMPSVYQKIDEVRSRNIPIVFSRLIQQGIVEGMVRPEVDPIFAGQFWLQAIRGMLDPDVLDRTQLTTRQTLEKCVHLFFNGILTESGNRQYRQHVEERVKQGTLNPETSLASHVL